MPTVSRRRPRDDDYDDEPEERPTRSRARDDDDEDEDRPRRSKPRARDEDDDDDEDEKPRRRARADEDDDDEEEDKPRKARAARDDDDDDDDDQPSKRVATRKGWAGQRENAERSSSFAPELKVDGKTTVLVKFLEDEPPVNYRQHWVDNPPGDIRKKSWPCIESDCPLCDIGDRPQPKSVFNVVHLNTGGEPEIKVLILGNKAAQQLKGYGEEDKTGPLSRLYYAISKSGEKQTSSFNFRPVKPRDLDEDWQMDALTEKQFKKYQDAAYEEADIVQFPKRQQLRELAKGLVGDDD